MDDGEGSGTVQGGFVSGPQAGWTADPSGKLDVSNQVATTVTDPKLTGSTFPDPAVSYDAAVHRWLPANRNQVKADGLAYAYGGPFNVSSGDAEVHIVSPATGSDRVLKVGSPAPAEILAFEPNGIYVTFGNYFDRAPSAPFLVDPSTGSVHPVDNVPAFQVVRDGVAWTNGFGPTPTKLTRIDLASQTSETWLDTEGQGWIQFVDLDGQGNPIVDIFQNQGPSGVDVLYNVADPSHPVALGAAPFKRTYAAPSDQNGTWFSASDGIYLLQPSDVLVKVADVSNGFAAGSCT